MKKQSGWVRNTLLVLLGLFAMVMGGLMYIGIPYNAAGMAAKGICSAAFVAGRPVAGLLAEDVLPASPVLSLIGVDVSAQERRVSATFGGAFQRSATLLPNRGCVLDVDSASQVTASKSIDAKPTAQAAGGTNKTSQPWPLGDAPLAGAEWGPGVNAAALQKVSAQVFVGAGDPQAGNARGFAVLHKGRLLVLQTAPGFGAQTPLHGWSMTKTVTGMLMDKLSVETAFNLETRVVDAFPAAREPVWLGAWRADARKAIKVSDLMYMRDGLASTEDYQPWGSVPKMLWGRPDAAAFAAEALAEIESGSRWRYLSQSGNLLSAVARGRFATDADYWAYPARALFDQIGANTAVLETDTSGNWVGSSYLWASVGDWARLGQLMLNDGRWGVSNEKQVLPPGWLKRAKTPSTPDGAGQAYGAQTWLYGHPTEGRCKGAGLPEDTLAMGGHWGQMVAMIPSRDVVVVRLGWTFNRNQFDGCALISEVLKALPG